jgi:hypothetical protein
MGRTDGTNGEMRNVYKIMVRKSQWKRPLARTGYTKFRYNVPGMILLQAYLYTYNLLMGVTFNDAATVGNFFETSVVE